MTTSTEQKQARKLIFKIQDLVNHGQTFTFQCYAWLTISEVKKQMEKKLKVAASDLRLFYKNTQLSKNGKSLLDYNFKNNDVLTVKITPQLQNSIGIINPYRIFQEIPQPITQMIENVKSGFLKGLKPKLADNGTSGSYFLKDYDLKTVAIFKPYDEQPFAPNNPRKYVGQLGSQGFRKGILSGQSAARQVAAFLLDSAGFHGVPPTTYIEFYHPSFISHQNNDDGPIKSVRQFNLQNKNRTKHGSLQAFVGHDDTIGNFGAGNFSIQQIHKIAMLDIRILNCDRNDTNILVKKYNVALSNGKVKKQYKLIPIDHGLSFPDNFEIYDYEVLWIDFPQTSKPFTERQLKLIESIDPVQETQYLKHRLEFRSICLRNFRIASIVLKQAAKLGLTLYDISQIIYRRQPDSQDSQDQQPRKLVKKMSSNLSQLQKLVNQAQNIYNIVKINGLKSSVEFQIGLIHPRSKSKSKAKLESIVQQQKQDEENKGISLKDMDNLQKPLKRGISLPHLKESTSFQQHQKDLKEIPLFKQISSKRQKSRKPKRGSTFFKERQDQKQWEDIFFHYFEDILIRYLKGKIQKKMNRSRFKSQCLP